MTEERRTATLIIVVVLMARGKTYIKKLQQDICMNPNTRLSKARMEDDVHTYEKKTALRTPTSGEK
jgi:hypothetical protein